MQQLGHKAYKPQRAKNVQISILCRGFNVPLMSGMSPLWIGISMRTLSTVQIIKGIMFNLCPNCLKGHVFSGIYPMNPQCPECGFKFEKEPGYFLGSVIAAYFICAFTLVPTLVFLFFVWNIEPCWIVAIGILQIAVLHPFLYRYSRLTWLFLENKITNTLDKNSE